MIIFAWRNVFPCTEKFKTVEYEPILWYLVHRVFQGVACSKLGLGSCNTHDWIINFLALNWIQPLKYILNVYVFLSGQASKSLYRQYLAFNTQTEQYECTICQQSCSRRDNLMRHIENKHFPDQNAVYPCKYCLKEFTNKSTMYSHVHTFHKNRKFYIQDPA